MRIRDRRDGYGLVTILLHWATMITVIGLYALGLWMVELDYYHRWYNDAPAIHKSVGMLLLAALIVALLWRLGNRRPDALPAMPAWQRCAATLAHLLLALLLFAVCLSGYLLPTAAGRGIAVFNWFDAPALLQLDDRQAQWAGAAHRYLSHALVVLAGVHALAALKHHFLDRDATLRRMLNPNQKRETP